MISFVIPAFRQSSKRVYGELLNVLNEESASSLTVLIDNPAALHSADFDIPSGLLHRVRVVQYTGNIGLSANLMNSIAHANRDWVWICGDDDDYTSFPTQRVVRALRDSSADIVKFSYVTIYEDRTGKKAFQSTTCSLAELAHERQGLDVGELIFTSNMAMRVQSFSKHLKAGFGFCDTLISHLSLILAAHEERSVSVRLSDVVVVGNNRYGDITWNRLRLYEDLLKISHWYFKSHTRDRHSIYHFCRRYVTAKKLGIELLPLFKGSLFRDQTTVLWRIAVINLRLKRPHASLFFILLMFFPLRRAKFAAVGLLRILSKVDERFHKYRRLLEVK